MKLALKRLTRSDLTFFEVQFRSIGAGNQKSINLNKEVFIDVLYPELPNMPLNPAGGYPVSLSIFGPGLSGEHMISRKIIKGGTYKNWRLNGEFVLNPDAEPRRYAELDPGDLALMVFHGDQEPISMEMFLVSSSNPSDAALHVRLSELLFNASMVAVDSKRLGAIASASPSDHPIHGLLVEPSVVEDLEEATLGSADAARRFLRRGIRHKVSAYAFAQIRESAEETGREGEAIVHGFLNERQMWGAFQKVEWASEINAISPFDFRLWLPDGTEVKVDVKSTAGDFRRPFHMSMAEIEEAADEVRYDIYRIYRMGAESACLRCAFDIGPFARTLREACRQLPLGIQPDGFSISVDAAQLVWGDELLIRRPGEDEVQS